MRKLYTALLCFMLCHSLLGQFDPAELAIDSIFTKVEQMPYFEGCEEIEDGSVEKRACSDLEMVRFISRYLVYPEIAKHNGIEGTVFVSFVIDENGEVRDPYLLKDIGGGCGETALNIILEMPHWTPGLHQGKKVKVRMNLPIQFFLRAKNRDAAEQYSLSWGTLNGQYTTKEELLENLDRTLYVRGPEGEGRYVDQIEFIFEKDNRLTSASSRGDITDELGKVVGRVK